MGKTCCVTGICGQDGYWLSTLLLEQGYTVHGLVRRHSLGCLTHLPIEQQTKVQLHVVDITDKFAVDNALMKIRPQEIYHLAAFSSVKESWKNPELVFRTNVLGTLNLLNSMLTECPEAKFFFPGSSEMFGDPTSSPQNEQTPFKPISPYGIAKAAAYHICRSYRDTYKLAISTSISYNHDSFCRPTDFVMAKICQGAAHIKRGLLDTIQLGCLDSQRDFGHAKDFANAYWNMLQGEPSEYVLAAGCLRTIREVCQIAFAEAGIPIYWHQTKTKAGETAVDSKGNIVIQVSYENFRPAENRHILLGDAKKAIKAAVFKPTVTFEEIIKEMVEFHMKE